MFVVVVEGKSFQVADDDFVVDEMNRIQSLGYRARKPT